MNLLEEIAPDPTAEIRGDVVARFRGLIAAGRYDPIDRFKIVFRLAPDPAELALERNRRWRATHREQWLGIQRAAYQAERQRPEGVERHRRNSRRWYLRHREERLSAARARRAEQTGPARPHKPYAPYRCSICGQGGHNRRACPEAARR